MNFWRYMDLAIIIGAIAVVWGILYSAWKNSNWVDPRWKDEDTSEEATWEYNEDK